MNYKLIERKNPRSQSGETKFYAYIMNMTDSACCGFKYFAFEGVRRVHIRVRGYCSGRFQVMTSWNGPVLAEIPVDYTDVWTDYSAEVSIPDGVHPLYFRYAGPGTAALLSFSLEK